MFYEKLRKIRDNSAQDDTAAKDRIHRRGRKSQEHKLTPPCAVCRMFSVHKSLTQLNSACTTESP